MRTRDRKVKGTHLVTYNWSLIPRKLLRDAQAKCRAEQPPIALKWKLIELVTFWLKGGGPSTPSSAG